MEYDFIVAPGADPKAIRLNFNGTDKARFDVEGDLLLHTKDGELRFVLTSCVALGNCSCVA